MLTRYRRRWVLPMMALLALPLLATTIDLTGAPRPLASTPLPWSKISTWTTLPRRVDTYLNDHFGLRYKLITANAYLRELLGYNGNDLVFVGAGDRLFFRGDEMIEQSAGKIRRNDRINATITMMTRMHKLLAARDIAMLVAFPPNASTIYPDDLPPWARADGRPTEIDDLLTALRAAHVPAVDLRPSLVALRETGAATYFHEGTHWTPLGAITGFNVIAAASDLPWRLDPASALGPPASMPLEEDLRPLLGLPDTSAETVDAFRDIPIRSKQMLTQGTFPTMVLTATHPGPTILVIGDSFTYRDFPSILPRFAGRVVFTYYRPCDFDFGLVDQFHPDQVWVLPTERNALCMTGVSPRNMPAE